jgi:predicted ATPase/DNA-binding XRE family transcriptional regulator
MSALGGLLRRQRELAGLTQEELADLAGLSARTVSDTERGLRSRIYPDTAERLAEALGLVGDARAAFLESSRGRTLPSSADNAALPRPLTPLVGRTRELDELREALRQRRLVTVTGLGGMGKTRLALAAAEQAHDEYAGGVRFVPLASNQDPRLLVSTVASALGADPTTAPAEVRRFLSGRRTLVVLDGCEHVAAAAPDVEELLLAVPDLHILATSRRRLAIAGERELPLGPLEVPDQDDRDWRDAPAVALFLDRVRDVRPDADDAPEVVIDICRRVSGLPLALELVAARARHVPLANLRARLIESLADLSTDEPRGRGSAPSMEETVAWSVASLDDDERQVLGTASVFALGWRLDAMQALCGEDVDVVRAMSGLVDKGLAFLDPQAGGLVDVPRWRMLDVLREFVGTLEQPPEAADLRMAYQAYFLDLLARVAEHIGEEDAWFRLLAVEEANVRSALIWAEDDQDAETLLRLANGMWQFWQARGGLAEGRQWLDSGLAMQPAASDASRMTALWGTAWLAYHQADDEAAEAAGHELRELADRNHDKLGERNAATLLGIVAISREDTDHAVELLQGAVRIAETVDRPWIAATSWLNLGMAHLGAGATDLARRDLGEALRRYEQVGDQRFHARCLGYLGLASLTEDDSGRARALFAQSLAAFRDLAEPGGTAEGLSGLAAVEARTGQPERAAMLAGAAERLRETFAGRELPLDRRTVGRFLDAARTSIDAQTWEQAWADGRDLDLDDAVALALSVPSP